MLPWNLGASSLRLKRTPVLVGVLLVVATTGLAQMRTMPDVATSEEDKAWLKVNGLDAASLSAFLREFPKGVYSQEAEVYLALNKKLADFMGGRIHSQDVITNAQLGGAWSSWKGRHFANVTAAETGGLFIEQTERDTSIGIFRVVGGGATPNGMYMQSNNTFLSCTKKVYLGTIPGHDFSLRQGPFWPGNDGSIVGINTGGVKASYFDLTFETNTDDTLVLGVVGKIGLVHLGGAGKVTLADGKVLTFK
jgi:hypothetical protein